jgi:hypothetical protein
MQSIEGFITISRLLNTHCMSSKIDEMLFLCKSNRALKLDFNSVHIAFNSSTYNCL